MASEEIKPLPGIVFIEPEDRAATGGVRKRFAQSGLVMPEPKFQGVPHVGRVYAVNTAERDIKVGMRVVFDEPNPHGIKWGGKKLIPVKRDQVLAGVEL